MLEIDCRKCTNLGEDRCLKYGPDCVRAVKTCAADGFKNYKPNYLTNADRVRAMDDTELAEVLMCPHDIDPDVCARKSCFACTLNWLRQPAEE